MQLNVPALRSVDLMITVDVFCAFVNIFIGVKKWKNSLGKNHPFGDWNHIGDEYVHFYSNIDWYW